MTALTIVVPGEGSNSLTFTVPQGFEFTPESVVASVDNSSGGDTTAELTVADQSGAVIAAKRQSEVVPGGDTGLATWALRLTDEVGGGGGGAAKIGFYDLLGTSVVSGVTTPLPFALSFGDALLDLTTPTRPVFVANGTYVIRATAFPSVLPNTPGKVAEMRLAMQHNYGTALTQAGSSIPLDAPFSASIMSGAMPWIVAAPTDMEVAIDHNAGANRSFFGAVNVMKIG